MKRYSLGPRGQTFVKGYVFLAFGKNISNNLRGKNSPETS